MSHHLAPPPRKRSGIAHYLALAERFVLIMIAIVLSLLAVLLLGSGVIAFYILRRSQSAGKALEEPLPE